MGGGVGRADGYWLGSVEIGLMPFVFGHHGCDSYVSTTGAFV